LLSLLLLFVVVVVVVCLLKIWDRSPLTPGLVVYNLPMRTSRSKNVSNMHTMVGNSRCLYDCIAVHGLTGLTLPGLTPYSAGRAIVMFRSNIHSVAFSLAGQELNS
jgi:hypothetical protein